MSLDRTLMRDMRRQQIMKIRLAQHQQRQGFTLPERVPVTLEQLVDVRKQLEDYLLRGANVSNAALN